MLTNSRWLNILNSNRYSSFLRVFKKYVCKCLRFFNKKTPLYAGLSSKQQNFWQMPSNVSERTLFTVWKIRQFFFHRANLHIGLTTPPPPVRFRSLFKDPPPPPSTLHDKRTFWMLPLLTMYSAEFMVVFVITVSDLMVWVLMYVYYITKINYWTKCTLYFFHLTLLNFQSSWPKYGRVSSTGEGNMWVRYWYTAPASEIPLGNNWKAMLISRNKWPLGKGCETNFTDCSHMNMRDMLKIAPVYILKTEAKEI